MRKIYQRKNRFVQNHSELTPQELYTPIDALGKQLYTYIPDQQHLRRVSDPWPHRNRSENLRTYADYFKWKYPDLTFNENAYLATLKGWRRPKINYMKRVHKSIVQKSTDSHQERIYHLIEQLQYAALNPDDFQILVQLPSILIRISQLYRIEKLRKLLGDNIQVHSVSKNVLMTNDWESIFPINIYLTDIV